MRESGARERFKIGECMYENRIFFAYAPDLRLLKHYFRNENAVGIGCLTPRKPPPIAAVIIPNYFLEIREAAVSPHHAAVTGSFFLLLLKTKM